MVPGAGLWSLRSSLQDVFHHRVRRQTSHWKRLAIIERATTHIFRKSQRVTFTELHNTTKERHKERRNTACSTWLIFIGVKYESKSMTVHVRNVCLCARATISYFSLHFLARWYIQSPEHTPTGVEEACLMRCQNTLSWFLLTQVRRVSNPSSIWKSELFSCS